MIIIKLQGGLGNQMFQYAFAKSLENNRKIKFDISSYKNDYFHREYKLDFFNTSIEKATLSEIKKIRGYEGFFRIVLKKIGFVLSRPKSFYQEQNTFDYCKDIEKYHRYFDGFWQNEKYFIDIREILLRDFTPISITNKAQHYLSKINYQSVSIHIRRSDYLKLRHIYCICDLDYYTEAMNLMRKTIENPIFFVFSDDITWCKNNLDGEFIFIEETTDIDDMFLMSKCSHNIIANSTFSWWGAWLNNNPNKQVIAPKKWFIDYRKDKNINVQKWVYI